MSKILLVEDDNSLGETLQERLTLEQYEVDWSKNLSDSRKLLEQGPYELIILDVGLPDGTGFEFAEEIQKRSNTPFIFVTAMASAEYRLKGYELGAIEFIPKPFHLRELLLRVSHVLENHKHHQNKSVQIGDYSVDFAAMSVIGQNGEKEFLAKRDCDVLRLLVEEAPEVVSRDQIIEKVWGEDKYPSNRTVDNVIVRIRSAIDDQSAELIRTVRGVGYQFVGQKKES